MAVVSYFLWRPSVCLIVVRILVHSPSWLAPNDEQHASTLDNIFALASALFSISPCSPKNQLSQRRFVIRFFHSAGAKKRIIFHPPFFTLLPFFCLHTLPSSFDYD
jgi:hypothetical protein